MVRVWGVGCGAAPDAASLPPSSCSPAQHSRPASSQARVFSSPSSVLPTSGISRILFILHSLTDSSSLRGSVRRVPMPPAVQLFFSPQEEAQCNPRRLGNFGSGNVPPLDPGKSLRSLFP